MELVHHIVHIAELVVWVPLSDDPLAPVELSLHRYVLRVLLVLDILLLLLLRLLVLLHSDDELDLLRDIDVFGDFWVQLGEILGESLIKALLEILRRLWNITLLIWLQDVLQIDIPPRLQVLERC